MAWRKRQIIQTKNIKITISNLRVCDWPLAALLRSNAFDFVNGMRAYGVHCADPQLDIAGSEAKKEKKKKKEKQ